MSNPVGRPTDYKDEYNEQVYKLCLLGAIDEELADFFGICVATLNTWKKLYPNFLASIKKGKQIADAEVSEKLYQRAKGYSHPDIDIRVCNNEIVETPLVKHYPPDATSAIFWLKNRQPRKWKDKHEVENINTNIEVTDQKVIDEVVNKIKGL
jgi:hypothetical protein